MNTVTTENPRPSLLDWRVAVYPGARYVYYTGANLMRDRQLDSTINDIANIAWGFYASGRGILCQRKCENGEY